MNHNFAQADATRLPFANKTFDFCFTSPPYLAARLYLEDGKNLGVSRDCADWVSWMLIVVKELCRVTKGLVIVNCAGQTRNWRYSPGPEGLLWEWWKQGGECWRPCIWQRVGIPGSGGKQWYRSDTEYLLAFKGEPGPLEWADPLANGHPPKWAPGGAMSHRLGDGRRVNQWGPVGGPGGMGAKRADGSLGNRERPSHVNQWGHSIGSGATVADGDFVRSKGKRPSHRNALGVRTDAPVGTRDTGLKLHTEKYRASDKKHTKRKPNGSMEEQGYNAPVLANPGNIVKIIVGGGCMGHPAAHENEAPFPIDLPSYFIKSHCKPGGSVLDPFCGSGTTVDAARQLGRIGIGCDLRFSQCELGRRRMATPYAKKVKRAPVVKPELTLFGRPGA